MPALACSCGILFAYSAGGVLSPHALSLSMAVPPTVLLVSLLWLPETPSFLINSGKIQDAAKIICWFNGSDFREDLTDVIEQQEVRIRTSECCGRREPMRRQDSDVMQPMLKRNSGLDSNSDKKSEPSACKELFGRRRCRRALVSCAALVSVAAGSGAGAVSSFAAAVLRHSAHAIPHLNLTAYNFTMYNGTLPRSLFGTSEAGSMLCGTALVLGAAVATVTVDKLGRKMLLLWSCSGIAFCLTVLGIYCDPRLHIGFSWYPYRLWPYKKITNIKEKSTHENITSNDRTNISELLTTSTSVIEPWYRVGEENDTITVALSENMENDDDDETIWLPVILLSIVLFLYNAGLGSVPYVLISELFSVQVRSLASSLIVSWMWLSNFILLRYFGTAAVVMGLHSTYYVSAFVTFLGSLYVWLVIPETKGKAREQIDEALDGPWLVCRTRRKVDGA